MKDGLDKKRVREKIRTLVQNKTLLNNIKDDVALLVRQPFLPSMLENYVEYKYFKYCLVHLENDITSNRFLSNISSSDLQKIASQVFSSRRLEHLPQFVLTIPHYILIKKESRLLSGIDKLSILRRIQVAVAIAVNSLTSTVVSKQSSVSTYMQFVKELYLQLKHVLVVMFQNVEDISKHPDFDPEKIWTYCKGANADFPVDEYETIYRKMETELKNFCERELSNGYALLEQSLEAAKSQLKKQLFQSPTLKLEYKNGRHTLTLKAPVILLGSHLQKIEEKLRTHPEVEEVHFVAAEVIYIDCSMRKEWWHGRNVLMMSKKVEVIMPGISWDLSGNSGKGWGNARADNGTIGDIDGKDGENGTPGESGGYCTFVADTLLNMNRLTVQMNGGAGGKGQSGGHGRNGDDGVKGATMTLAKLLSDFDPPSKNKGVEEGNARRKTLQNLKNAIEKYEDKRASGMDWDSGDLVGNSLYGITSCHIKGHTCDGMEIEFGYYSSRTFPVHVTRQTYCLVKGAQGTPGSLGGFGGCKGAGGKGGYGGTVAAYKLNGGLALECGIKWEGAAGDDGENGLKGDDGAHGRCGENGGDVGYVDYMWWGKAATYGPGGTNEGGTFELKEYDTEQEVSAWCEYHKKWMSIKKATRDPPQPLENNRQRKNKVTEKVAATRKNTVDHKEAINEHAKEMMQGVSIGVDMNEMEFQQTMRDVITKSHELVQSEKRLNEKHQKRRHIKVKISKPAPQTGRLRRRNGKQKRKGIMQRFMKGVQSKIFGSTDDDQEAVGDDELVLSRKRFQTLEQIRPKVEQGWKNKEKTKIVNVKHPTSGKGHASALHALFGEVNNLGFYEAPSKQRQEVHQKLKDQLENWIVEGDTTTQENLKESLFAYFQDESIMASSKDDKHIPALHQYRENFRENPEAFDWDKLLSDKKAVHEYVDFLGEPTVPYLISDLRLIAYVHNIPVEIYMSYDGSSALFPLRQKINEGTENADPHLLHLAVNEHHEFSRMVPVAKPDLSEIHEEMRRIVREVHCLNDKQDIEEYLQQEKFGANGDDQHEEISDEAKMLVIQDISEIFHSVGGEGNNETMNEEKLVIETALQMWPEMMLKVFHERIQGFQGDLNSFRNMFSRVVEEILNGKGADEELTPFLWITATYPTDQWTTELCLLSLREHFDGVKNVDVIIWRTLMKSFPQKLVDCIRRLVESGGDSHFDPKDKKTFNLFLKSMKEFEVNSDMDFSKLENVDRSQWPFQLRKLFIASRLEKLPNVKWDNDKNKQTQALYYLHALYNEKPNEVKGLLNNLKKTLEFQRRKTSDITQILQNFYGGLWTLNQDTIEMLENSTSVEEWKKLVMKKSLETIGKTRSLAEIKEIVEKDSNSNLPTDDLFEIVEFVRSMDQMKLPSVLQHNFTQGMQEWLKDFHNRKHGSSSKLLEMQLEALAYIDFVIQIKLHYSLRPTQKLAIVSALHQGSLKDTNLLSQIATGEGKTCVVIAVAICRGLFDEKTDVVTSSGVLAQRDATLYTEIYSAFGLTVGEVTGESADERRKAYLCTVVYGEASHFERDYLLDRFYNQNIRGSRPFGNVIVDEVDSMFLDKGNSVLYLSHQPPDLDSLENLFVFIWMNVVQLSNHGEYHPMRVHELVLSAMYPTITVEDLLTFLAQKQVQHLWEWLIEKKVINANGRISVQTADFPRKLPENFLHAEKPLKYLIRSRLESSGRLPVMNYLKPFVEQHLFTWIHSAFQSTQLTEGKEYVVDVDHTKTVLDKNPRIMILDLDTGVDLRESQWNEGLHQFLQLKHGCRIAPMNLKAVFISNISYFKKYGRIFGLTGTIGTESDRQFLKDTYQVQVLCIPLAQPKQFVEQEPIICKDIGDWKSNIFQETEEKLDSGRSVLVVCGTVQEAELLFAHFKTKAKDNVELYRRDYEQFKATEQGTTLSPGQVLIATNLAGRGTDIKLSQELSDNGGLHVILSYLPDNLRVEQQAFGRAARCGDMGSGRLVFLDKVEGGAGGDAIDMKIQRDDLEISRVSDIQSYYTTVILKEEDMFKTFQQSFEELTGTLEKAYKYVKDHQDKETNAEEDSNRMLLNGHIEEMKELVMYSMLDDWAFWLDKYSTILLNKNNHEYATLFDKGLHRFEIDGEKNMQDFMNMTDKYEQVKNKYQDPNWLQNAWDWSKSKVGMRGSAGAVEDYSLTLIHEPALLIKVAKVKVERGEVEQAEKYLDEVIRKEPENAKVAKYYKLFCKLKLGEWQDSKEFDQLKQQVMESLEDWRIRESSHASGVSQIQSVGNQQSLHGEGYKQQKEGAIRLSGVYLHSVESMTGNERLMATDFARLCGDKVGEHLIQYLVMQGALLDTSFTCNMDPERIKKLADGFCIEECRMSQILANFKGERLTCKVEKELKKQLDLPSRGGFWKEIQSCLDEMETFAVVQPQAQVQEDASTSPGNKSTCERNDFTEWAKARKAKFIVSKYGADMGSKTPNQTIVKGKKLALEQEQKYRFLRKSGRLCYEQVATLNIDKLKKLTLKNFSKIGKDAFAIIPEITVMASGEIFDILHKSKIIDEDGELLTTEWIKEKLDLTVMWEVYRADILSILRAKCRYKYELLSILHQTAADEPPTPKTEDVSEYPAELQMSLPSRPRKDFIMTCMHLGLMKGYRANPKYFETGFLENVFREPVSWAKWVGEKTGIIGGDKAKVTFQDLQGLYPDENPQKLEQLYRELKDKSWVNSDGLVVLDIVKNSDFRLSSSFEYHEPDVYSLVQWEQERVKENFLKDALQIVVNSQGQLKTLDNPDANLVDIEAYLGGGGTSMDVQLSEQVSLLALSGFDHVIDTVERAYSWKMISSAVAIILIGVIQIALGVLLEFKTMGLGTFIAGGLISEGIGDIIYGVMAFKSGHFSWQDWVDNKWQSVAITGITIGVGALLAKGVKYSKYGERLFGSWGKEFGGHVIQETLKEGGKAGIKRSIWPVLLKSFGYKVLQGCAMAGGSMAVSYAYNKALKKVVEIVSTKIFANTHDTIEKHQVSTTLGDLCDICGVVKAQEIVDRCSNQVLKGSSCEADSHVYLKQMATPLLNGLRDATAKMNRAGTFSNQESSVLMLLMQVCSGLMTTANVMNSIMKMNESITKYIKDVEGEIKKEMEGVKAQSPELQRNMATESEKQEFIWRFKERTNEVMKQKIGAVMQYTIIEPLMNMGCQKLITSVGRMFRDKYREYREGKIMENVNKVKFELMQNPDAPEEVKRDLHRQVLQLCSQSRDPRVIAHAVEFGGPLGVESVQALADMLGVTIVVTSNNSNTPSVFKPQNGSGGDGSTLHLKHTTSSDDPNDLGHWESGSDVNGEGSSGSTGSPDCLLDAINNEWKAKFGGEGGQGINRHDLANFMRTDENFKEFVKSGCHHTYHSLGGYGGAKFEELEITNRAEKDNEINRMKQIYDELKDQGSLEKVDEALGPIQEYALEEVNGKKVLHFQAGEVTAETLKNAKNEKGKVKRQKPSEEERRTVMEDGCMNPKHEHVGHGTPAGWGTPVLFIGKDKTPINAFPQNASSNSGVNRDIEQVVQKWVAESPNNSVSYMRLFEERGGHTGRRPQTHWHYYVFKTDGKVNENREPRIFKVSNPACNCPPPERGNIRRRGHG